MPEKDEHMDTVLAISAAVAEDAVQRVRAASLDAPHDELYVLAGAMAWAALRRYWGGDDRALLQRWRIGIPDAMSHFAERIGIRRSS